MTVSYSKHPAGYPQVVYGVRKSGRGWRVTVDTWDTPTSHRGAVDSPGPVYRTKKRAELVAIQLSEEELQ